LKLGIRVPSAFILHWVADPPITTETHGFAVTHPKNTTVFSLVAKSMQPSWVLLFKIKKLESFSLPPICPITPFTGLHP
jgi:hypothetical protein